jgi:hypothetical protein
MGNVLPFPCAAIVRHEAPKRSRRKAAAKTVAEPMLSPEREERLDRMAELLAERAKRRIAEWQAQEGMPDEETMLLARLEALSGRPGGLNNWTLWRLDALLTFAGWRSDDA